MYWVTSLTKAPHGKAHMPFSLHSQASRLDQEGPLEIGPEQQEEELNSCTGHELKQLQVPQALDALFQRKSDQNG